jgi:hypothetical protein
MGFALAASNPKEIPVAYLGNKQSPDYVFKGPKLLDAVAQLLREHEYNGPKVERQFNVGKTWYSDVVIRQVRTPNPDKLQEMYEVLSGGPLIK